VTRPRSGRSDAAACAKAGCARAPTWRPVIVVLRDGPALRIDVPADVCDRHKRSVRALLARRALPRVEEVLRARRVSAQVAILGIEFRPLA
jgi:hypothetical protein